MAGLAAPKNEYNGGTYTSSTVVKLVKEGCLTKSRERERREKREERESDSE